MPKTTVILNPAAANGRAGRAQQRIISMLAEAGIEASIVLTAEKGHAIDLATVAARHSNLVVAAGGDGTIHEVANGIIQSGESVTLGVIPFGTGNDFVKMLDVPVHLESAIKILAKGKRKAVDYGTVSFKTKRDSGRRFFINTLGFGFDAEVGHRASSFKALPGFLAYLAALLFTLQRLQQAEAQIHLFGEVDRLLYRGPCLLSSVGNGHTSGGLFKLTPDARIDDGWLDVCAIAKISVPKLLMRVPSVLHGTHTKMQEYFAGKAKNIKIELLNTDEINGLPVHADGEIIATEALALEVQIVEQGISVIIP